MNKDNAILAKEAIEKELTAQNIPLRFMSFIMPQLAVETGGFESKVSKNANNLSGMTYAGQHWAKDSGISLPAAEVAKYGKRNYAAYPSYSFWAKDYISWLKRKGIFEATTLDGFADSLKEKGYFTAKIEDYKKALNSWKPQLTKLFSDIDFKTGAEITGLVLILFIFTFLFINYAK